LLESSSASLLGRLSNRQLWQRLQVFMGRLITSTMVLRPYGFARPCLLEEVDVDLWTFYRSSSRKIRFFRVTRSILNDGLVCGCLALVYEKGSSRFSSKLRDSEAQSANMQSQLARLRTHLLSSAPIIVEELDLSPPSPNPDTITSVEHPQILDEALPVRERHERDHQSHRRRRYPTMGDAEAEHLLLAGKRLGAVRRVVRTTQPVVREEEEEPAQQADESYKPTTRTPGSARQRRRRASSSGAAGRGGNVENDPPQPSTAFGGMDELLQAAQTVLTRQTTPERGEPSSKRRRTSSMPGMTFSTRNGAEEENAGTGRGKRARRVTHDDDIAEEEGSTGTVAGGGGGGGETTPKASMAPSSNRIMRTPTNSTAAVLFKPADDIFSSPSKSSPESSQKNRVFSALDVLADQATASQQSSTSTALNEDDVPSPSPRKRRSTSRHEDSDLAERRSNSGSLGDPFMLRTRSGPFKPDADPGQHQTANRGSAASEAGGSPESYTDSPNFGYSSSFGMPAPQASTSASISGGHFPNLSPTLNPLGLPPPSNPPPHLQHQTTPPQQQGRRLAPAPAAQSSSAHPGSSGGTPGASSEEAKRQRSPYVKWNIAEDELLVKAVVEHGQRWDSVSKLGEKDAALAKRSRC
jgi:hypothetical protein